MAHQKSFHDRKYDRQMRLWGGHGQKRLETAHLLCFGSGPTASETLKNLVLPNVGELTIVDDAIVTEADLGNNWFVDDEGMGKPRAEVVKDLLLEMNDGVKGHALVKSPTEVIDTDPGFLKDFTVVIAACLPPGAVRKLGVLCAEAKIPLVILRSYGLTGYARLQAPELCIEESHYDNNRMDLYVTFEQLKHFTELNEYVNSFDLANITDSMEYGHVPFIAILGQAVQTYVKEGGVIPSREARQGVSDIIKKMVRDSNHENFSEALDNVHRAINTPQFDFLVKRTLDDAKAKNIDKDSTKFWVTVAALNRFMANEGEGFPPVSTAVPDMVSLPESYQKLKSIFKERARKDAEAVFAHAQAIEKEAGQDATITLEEVTFFCTHCRGVQILRTRSLEEEYNPETFDSEEANEIMEEWKEANSDGMPDPPKILHWYFGLRAVDAFYIKNKKLPTTDADAKELNAIAAEIMTQNKMRIPFEADVGAELVRCEGTEIHNIAAFVGGVGSQICLKLLIGQYIPLNHTLLFDGVHGAAKAFAV